MIKAVLLDIDGVITNGKIQINSAGEEVKQIDFKDIDAIFELKRKGYKIGVITGENTPIVDYFRQRFPFDYFYNGCKDKVTAIHEIEKTTKVTREEICYVGDGMHDIPAIKYVGLGVCPADAIRRVKQEANYILETQGGCGCVDELLYVLDSANDPANAFFNRVYQEHEDMFHKIIFDRTLQQNIMNAAELIVDVFKRGGQLLLCGNGGSAADAQHIATEFISRFYKERSALNAEALTVNTSSLTAIGNDYTFDSVFSRQVEAKGRKGDVLIGISTSGRSKNVLKAFDSAKKLGMNNVFLAGGDAEISASSNIFDIAIPVPSVITPRIQEAHIFIGHLICEYVEGKLFG